MPEPTEHDPVPNIDKLSFEEIKKVYWGPWDEGMLYELATSILREDVVSAAEETFS